MTRPYVRLLTEAARSLGGQVRFDPVFQHTGTYISAQNRHFALFGNALGINSDAAMLLCADKTYTIGRLASVGMQVPDGILALAPDAFEKLARKFPHAALSSLKEALLFAQKNDFQVYLKPNSGRAGEDVYCSRDEQTFHNSFSALMSRHSHIRIEAPVIGQDCRVLVLDGKARAVYLRRPFGIVGNGQDTARVLVEKALESAGNNGFSDMDVPDLIRTLGDRKMTLETVLPKDETFPLRPNANLTTGGTMADLSHRMPTELCAIAVDAARAVGLRYAGVDLITPDSSGNAGATVLEVNSSPGLDGFSAHGPVQWALAREILSDVLSALEENSR